jgi:hypothetical protein
MESRKMPISGVGCCLALVKVTSGFHLPATMICRILNQDPAIQIGRRRNAHLDRNRLARRIVAPWDWLFSTRQLPALAHDVADRRVAAIGSAVKVAPAARYEFGSAGFCCFPCGDFRFLTAQLR